MVRTLLDGVPNCHKMRFAKKKSKRQKNGPGRVQDGRKFPPFGRIFPPFGRVWWTPLKFGTPKMRLGGKKAHGRFWTVIWDTLIIHWFITHALRKNSSPFRWQLQPLATPQILCHQNKVAIIPGVAPIIVGVHVNEGCFKIHL